MHNKLVYMLQLIGYRNEHLRKYDEDYRDHNLKKINEAFKICHEKKKLINQ